SPPAGDRLGAPRSAVEPLSPARSLKSLWRSVYPSADAGIEQLFAIIFAYLCTVFLKRNSMALQCGIVGLPNVGKSTLFNCLSNAKAQAANFPFCTIEPNVGVITVPDERLNKLAELVKPQRVVPNTIEIVDIAGLVKGASKGEGLG